jgi:hypothetical protein
MIENAAGACRHPIICWICHRWRSPAAGLPDAPQIDSLLFLILILNVAAMRIAGSALLVIGFLLCVSIAWAAIGFIAMGFGLILLLIAEERKMSVLHLEITAQPDPLEARQPVRAPILAVTEEVRRDEHPTELDEEWRLLVESDQDLSRVATVLRPFGPKYVDQLARAYLAFNDKAFLPIILNMIIASARKDAGLLAEEKLQARDAAVSSNDQTHAAQAQPGSLRTPASLATAEKSFAVGRKPTGSDGAAIDPSQTESPTLGQGAPLQLESGQTSEGPSSSDDLTTEAAGLASVPPPAPDAYSDEAHNLKGLFDRLTLSPGK